MDVLGERIGRLTGKVALIRVGAATPAELKEKRHRVEDALSATRAAVAEGILAGGGSALLHCEQALDRLSLDGDYATVSVAVRLRWEKDACAAIRVAVGSCAPTPFRVPAAEQALIGTALDAAALDNVAKAYAEAADPAEVSGQLAARLREAAGTCAT